MTLQGEREALIVSPPQAFGSGLPNAVFTEDILAAASAPVDLGIDIRAVRAEFSFMPNVDCYIAFGDNAVAATASCWLLIAGNEYRYECDPTASRYFSVMRVAGSGVLRYYCSQPSNPHT